MVNNATIIYHNMVALLTIKWLIRAHGEGEMKFKSCNLHFGWNGDLNFNIRDVEFSLYSFNLFNDDLFYFDCVHCDFKFI